VSPETYRERVLAHLRDVYSSIRPLAWLDADLRLNFVGSALLFQVGGIRLLVTAAHVLDVEAQHGQLYVSAPNGPSPLGGIRRWTQAPSGDRRSDPLDLGFVLLDAPTAHALETCRFLGPSDVDPSLDDPELPQDCLAIGFPANWISAADSAKHVAIPMLASGPRILAADHVELGVAEPVHVLMAFDKEMSVDLEGPRVAPDPFGISGGGMWRFASLRGAQGDANQLLGVLIEWRGSALIATRAGILLSALRDLVPGVRAELSNVAPDRVRHGKE
jgi:hypothetical protein